MKNKILATVSVIALMGALPALAETAKAPTKIKAEASTIGDIVEDAKVAIKDIKGDTSEAYEEIKTNLISDDDKDLNVSNVTINKRATANSIIGRPVYNNISKEHKRIGTIKDIIVDGDGKGMMMIVADGNFFATGKLAAFDYEHIMKVDSNGDVFVPLTEGSINFAAEFSYDRDDYSDSVRVIPSNGYSLSKLLDGQLIGDQGAVLGQIHDIQLKNSKAEHLIISFDQTPGIGGEQAAISYGSTRIVQDGDDYDFQLSAGKTAQFENYKKNSTN